MSACSLEADDGRGEGVVADRWEGGLKEGSPDRPRFLRAQADFQAKFLRTSQALGRRRPVDRPVPREREIRSRDETGRLVGLTFSDRDGVKVPTDPPRPELGRYVRPANGFVDDDCMAQAEITAC